MMAEPITSTVSDPNRVRKVIDVEAPQRVAWRVFTEQMGTWWPLAMYKIGKANAVDAIIEPRLGGRWYERGEDGSTCDWGRVLAWQPHDRLVLSIAVPPSTIAGSPRRWPSWSKRPLPARPPSPTTTLPRRERLA